MATTNCHADRLLIHRNRKLPIAGKGLTLQCFTGFPRLPRNSAGISPASLPEIDVDWIG